MKLGLGMHPERWSDAHLAMARQLGCETVVPWVPFGPGDGVWHEEQFAALKAQAKRHGLEIAAVENFHWEHIDHIVLGEEGRDEQLENLCRTIENAGRCGIPCFGYNFSCCGVQGYYAEVGNAAGRGLASLKCFDESKVDHAPQPNRKFWFKDEIARRSRNTSGTRPRYNEVFIDDGYVDMKRAMAIYEKCGFDGTVIPDHTPRLTAADWWETGMAFALGYMRGIMP